MKYSNRNYLSDDTCSAFIPLRDWENIGKKDHQAYKKRMPVNKYGITLYANWHFENFLLCICLLVIIFGITLYEILKQKLLVRWLLFSFSYIKKLKEFRKEGLSSIIKQECKLWIYGITWHGSGHFGNLYLLHMPASHYSGNYIIWNSQIETTCQMAPFQLLFRQN